MLRVDRIETLLYPNDVNDNFIRLPVRKVPPPSSPCSFERPKEKHTQGQLTATETEEKTTMTLSYSTVCYPHRPSLPAARPEALSTSVVPVGKGCA